jgi:hypothetical protein
MLYELQPMTDRYKQTVVSHGHLVMVAGHGLFTCSLLVKLTCVRSWVFSRLWKARFERADLLVKFVTANICEVNDCYASQYQGYDPL